MDTIARAPELLEAADRIVDRLDDHALLDLFEGGARLSRLDGHVVVSVEGEPVVVVDSE
jgi:hypothetical protein